MDNKTISKFVDFITDGYEKVNNSQFWELRFIRKDGKVEQHWFNDPEEIKKFLVSHKTYSWNSYIGILPRSTKSGLDSSVNFGNVLAVDIDSPAAVDKADEIYQRLAEKNLRPSLVVASGSGIHVYYKLRQVIPALTWKSYQDRLIIFFQKEFPDLKIDPTIRNPSRVMRVIGSLNVKYEKPLKTYFLIEDYSVYSVADIELMLPNLDAKNPVMINHSVKAGKIKWIENLHKTPISDIRHRTIDNLLIPYCKNYLRLSENEATKWIMSWVNECNKLKPTTVDENYVRKKFRSCETIAESKAIQI